MKHPYSLLIKIIILSFLKLDIINAQDVKKVTPLGTHEEYFVLKSNKKIKHGEYKRFHPFKTKVVIIKGQYENNKRTGVWEYFDRLGNPNQRFDYTNNKVLYHQVYSTFTISRLVGGEPVKKLSSPPIYLNGEMALIEWMIKNVKYPVAAARTKTSGVFLVYFTVDKFGKPNNFHVKGPAGFGLDDEALRAVKSIPSDFWFPGMIDEEPVDVEIYIPVSFIQD